MILVTSSREAAPLVILEAQAAGTPWVAFDVGSNREHAGGSVVGSRSEMAGRVLELLGDPAQAKTLAAEGRPAATASGGWERVVDRHERLCGGEE